MKKSNNRTVLIFTIFSIILCGCSGLAFLLVGLSNMADTAARLDSFSRIITDFNLSYLRGVWQVCLSGILLLVPIVMVLLVFVQRSKKTAVTPLEPTGVSTEDPIPPTR